MSERETSGGGMSVALLDTSIQVDRVKTGSRREQVEASLAPHQFTISTSISLLEFKATVIQECVTIHNRLKQDCRFTFVRDELIESTHPQHKLRAHIFNNLINIHGRSSFEVTDPEDRRLADEARLQLEDVIPMLYDWFHESVGGLVREPIPCDRAFERPEKKKAAFSAGMPICKRGKNKACKIEDFIRESSAELCDAIDGIADCPDQLKKARDLFAKVAADNQADLSHSQCRTGGDCLIALQGRGKATHAVSTNAREWGPLCQILGYQFVQITYEKPKA